MKKHLFSLILFVTTIGTLSGPAFAAPVVAVGSTYSVYLEGSQSGDAFLGLTEFDDSPGTALRSSMTLTLGESEASLGGGRSRISISLSASGELFPAFGEFAILAIGVDGDGLDLLRHVSLDDARITFFASSREILRTDNLAGQVQRSHPWTGFFPAPLDAFGIADVGGLGVSRVTFDFTVTDIPSEVPEPGSVLLAGIALVGVIAARRRQRKFGDHV